MATLHLGSADKQGVSEQKVKGEGQNRVCFDIFYREQAIEKYDANLYNDYPTKTADCPMLRQLAVYRRATNCPSVSHLLSSQDQCAVTEK